MKVAFFGTPEFAMPSLRALTESRLHKVVCVVTQPDRPGGRGLEKVFLPVKKFAVEHNIPVFQPEKISEEITNVLDALPKGGKPDIIVTCAFGQMLRASVLEACRYGVINVHASLLPKYRGSSPIQWALINGEKETGVTIMQTDIGMDTGDILYQETCGICEEETAGELSARLALLGAGALLKTLNRIEDGTVTRKPQNHTEASTFPMLKKKDGLIDFNKTPAQIVNFVRGLNPRPIAYFKSNLGDIRVYKASVRDGKVQFDVIQAPGGRVMPYKDLTNGRKLEIYF
jgi:methionyl-tRNA formyltransferase